MVILFDGDASSSAGVPFARLASLLSESGNDSPALRFCGIREDCERGVLNTSICGRGDFLSDGDIDNKFCRQSSVLLSVTPSNEYSPPVAGRSRLSTYLELVVLVRSSLLDLAGCVYSSTGSVDFELCIVDVLLIGMTKVYHIFAISYDHRSDRWRLYRGSFGSFFNFKFNG